MRPILGKIGSDRAYSSRPAHRARGWKTQIGDRVRFSLESVFLPGPEEALESLSLKSEVEGRIIDFSDSGDVRRAFAVVDVVRRQIVVLPVDKVRLEPEEDQSGKETV
jgi:hypothetical protein